MKQKLKNKLYWLVCDRASGDTPPVKLLGELHATHSRWEATDFGRLVYLSATYLKSRTGKIKVIPARAGEKVRCDRIHTRYYKG